jgi:uncharacterized protein (TIGR03067 family)
MRTLACVILSAALAVPAGEEKEAPKDLDKLQGVWNITAVMSRGSDMTAFVAKTAMYTLVVAGDHYVFSTHGGTITLDAAKGTVDLDIKSGRYAGNTLLGRYELKGDTLKLILPASVAKPDGRVPELKAGEAHPGLVCTFERDAKATKEQAAAQLKDRTDALPGRLGGGVGGKGFGGGPAGAAKGGFFNPPAAATEKLLERILERLERIDERLDALEKKLPAPNEKK